MSNSPSQMIPDMLDWRQIWESGRSRKGSPRNGHHDPKCPSARRLRMVQEDTGAPNEGTTCASMAADEAVGCTHAFLTTLRSSRRQVCRGRPEHDLRVNDISRIHWSQHLRTAQSERPN
ncbi:uncharacterized protein TNCV_2243801 [Trichonephila clavipes]|nr:uncharacterized protein TNCV_2243801 [Trichonephila clavipes]